MQGAISFLPNGADPAEAAGRHRAAACAAHRYLPHVVTRRCPGPGAPISLVLPESLSARELVQRAAAERVELATGQDPAAPDRVVELHYAHLAEADIDEGLCRLGRCLVRYLLLAARSNSGEPAFHGL
jgi:DNA-binding transcriptional MocR family regulator